MIKAEKLHFFRWDGHQQQAIINNLSFELEDGEQLALLGDSGSGKTTLLNLLAGLLVPDDGRIIVDHKAVTGRSVDQLAQYRRSIGLIFQQYQLLAPLTVKDNILFQYRLNGLGCPDKDLADITERLGINHKLNALPHQLSGGEQQRVGIARALIHRPSLVLADEPTGNLDQDRSLDVVRLMTDLCQERQVNLIMVTHSHQLADFFTRTHYLKNGCLYQDSEGKEAIHA